MDFLELKKREEEAICLVIEKRRKVLKGIKEKGKRRGLAVSGGKRREQSVCFLGFKT